MIKKMAFTLAVLLGGISFGQGFPYPVDGIVGQRWVGTSEAAFYGAVKTYLPLGFELFSVDVYGIPELGVDRDTLEPYARFELNLDSDYATLAAFATYMGGVPRINLEARFCILSDRCGE